MLIFMTAELQIRQDGAFRLCQPVQSWSFAFMYDAGWSLRRAGAPFVLPNLQFGSGEYKHLQCGKKQQIFLIYPV
jgi:hypothetical protein